MVESISKSNLTINLLTYPFSISNQNGSGVSRYNYELKKALLNNKIFNLMVETNKQSNNKWIKFILRLINTERNIVLNKYDLIHATSPYSRFFSIKLSKKPIVTSIHDTIWINYNFKVNNKFTRMRYLVNKYSIENSDYLFVPFEYTKLKITEYFKIREDKIIVLPYGMNTDNYIVRGKFEAKNPIRLIFFGGVNPIARGALLTIDAFYKFRKTIPHSILYFSSTNNPEFKEFIKVADPKMLENVEFIPFVEEREMPKFFSQFDLMVYPTDMGFSYLLIQAFAAGLPVITTDVYDIPEFLNGLEFLCRPKDPESFAEAMIDIITNESKYNLIQDRLKKVAYEHSSMRLCSEVIKAYNIVLK